MKIKRFNEVVGDEMDISNERSAEIVSQLSNIAINLDSNREKIESISNELSNYKGKSKKSNDQIDDSIINLDLSRSKLEEMISSIDVAVNNLKDYIENGRKFLY